jgi:glyceraldehyde-3-phosphate dehydrogenase/erythrose-4-phosphate dehydrogenase
VLCASGHPSERGVVSNRTFLPTRIGINGFGRLGRLALRAGWGRPDLQFVHINEISLLTAALTMVVDGTRVKVLAWYDNEIGYVNRLIELTQRVGASL